MIDWHVAVYCSNEAPHLAACLRSVVAALGTRRARITVMLNGSVDGCLQIAQAASATWPMLDVITITAGDKSNAINRFLYDLREPAALCAGVDGYAILGRHAFGALEAALAATPHAMAVTGVAGSGRSTTAATRSLLEHGGRLHGQLHAFRGLFLDRLVARGIRLPVGLYRGDGLLGSMVAHDLDPLTHPWDGSRIAAAAGADFQVPRLLPVRPRDIRRLLHRRVRQMRGQIENEAIKAIIYRGGYEALPPDGDAMIRNFLATHPPPPVAWPDTILQRIAIDRALAPPPRNADHLVPRIADRHFMLAA